MARTADLNWPMGSHTVAAPIGVLRAIQDEAGAGPEFCADAIRGNSWTLEMVFAACTHGLVGGGMATGEARKLVLQCFEENGALALKPVALAVLTLGLIGFDEEPKNGDGEGGGDGEGKT